MRNEDKKFDDEDDEDNNDDFYDNAEDGDTKKNHNKDNDNKDKHNKDKKLLFVVVDILVLVLLFAHFKRLRCWNKKKTLYLITYFIVRIS